MSTRRLIYGPNKYAAFNLIIARWARNHAQQNETYIYVTLGGTELKDVINMAWIDSSLTSIIISYEYNKDYPERYKFAKDTVERLKKMSLNIQLRREDIFEYRRDNETRHIFFLDFERSCTSARADFQSWFDKGVVQPGDFLIITSYLGRNPGWERILAPFDGEFRVLNISSLDRKRHVYRMAHPSFVLYRALCDAGCENYIQLTSIGCIKYTDTSTMGLYGFVCNEGNSRLPLLVENLSIYDIKSGLWER